MGLIEEVGGYEREIEFKEDKAERSPVERVVGPLVDGHICFNNARIKFIPYHSFHCSMCKSPRTAINIRIEEIDIKRLEAVKMSVGGAND